MANTPMGEYFMGFNLNISTKCYLCGGDFQSGESVTLDNSRGGRLARHSRTADCVVGAGTGANAKNSVQPSNASGPPVGTKLTKEEAAARLRIRREYETTVANENEAVTVEIPMEYPGWSVGKNGMFNAGNRRFGYNQTASAWKASLAGSIRTALQERGVTRPSLPVHVTISCKFVDRSRALDPHNMVEPVLDTVEEALGKPPFNDRDFTVSVIANEYGVAVPQIIVTLSVGHNPARSPCPLS